MLLILSCDNWLGGTTSKRGVQFLLGKVVSKTMSALYHKTHGELKICLNWFSGEMQFTMVFVALKYALRKLDKSKQHNMQHRQEWHLDLQSMFAMSEHQTDMFRYVSQLQTDCAPGGNSAS